MGKVVGAARVSHHPGLMQCEEFRRAMGAGEDSDLIAGFARLRAKLEAAKPDVVLSTYPPIEALDIGLYLSSKFAVPLVADFRDGLLFEPVEPQMLRSNSTLSRYRGVEQAIARQAAAIITVSDPISDYFETEYNHGAVVTVPNGFDPDDRWVEPSSSELDRTKFNLVYTGRLGLSEKGRHASAFVDGVTRAVKASPELTARLRIHLIGEFSSNERGALSNLIELGTVRLHPFVERLLVATSGKMSVATSKLFEYLASGRPILGITRKTAAEKIILQTHAGFVVDPEDPEAIKSMLTRLVLKPELISGVKRNESEIEKYSRPNQMRILAEFLKQIVTVRSPSKVTVSR